MLYVTQLLLCAMQKARQRYPLPRGTPVPWLPGKRCGAVLNYTERSE